MMQRIEVEDGGRCRGKEYLVKVDVDVVEEGKVKVTEGSVVVAEKKLF